MLSKIEQVDLIEIVSDNVQVRTRTTVMDGDTVVSTSYHRKIILPGQDYSNEDKKVQDICATVHTQEAIAAYRAQQDQYIASLS
jgi:hypothetical protein